MVFLTLTLSFFTAIIAYAYSPAVESFSFYTIGLKSDGSVVATGRCGYGQCDVNSWSGIIQVAAGGSHTIGLKSDGSVTATGLNDHGQCNVSAWSDIQQVAAGNYHTIGLKSDGSVTATGLNDDDSFEPDMS